MPRLIFHFLALARSTSSPSSSVFSPMALLAASLLAGGGFVAPASADVLISNIGQTDGSNGQLKTFDQAQEFTTGSNSTGYTLSSVEIYMNKGDDNFRQPFSVEIWSSDEEVDDSADSDNIHEPHASLGALTISGSFEDGINTFTTTNISLEASTTYLLVIDSSADSVAGSKDNIQNTNSDDEDSGGATGWSIGNASLFRGNGSTGLWGTFNQSKKIRINGATNTAGNTPPTATDNTVTVDEDESYTFTAADFNFGDADTSDTLASVKIVTLEAAGELELDGTAVTENQVISSGEIGSLVFSPAADGNGAPYDSFTFKVNDGEDDSTAAYTMTINVDSVPDVTDVSVTSTPRSGTANPKDTYGLGEVIEVTVTFDEAVTVDTSGGTPFFRLRIRDNTNTINNRDATLLSGSGTTALVFGYTVVAADDDDNGIWIPANALMLNSGTIRDSANNNADVTHEQLGTLSGHKVDGSIDPPDTTPPTVTGAEVTMTAPKSLVITFSEALDTGSEPAASAFTVKVGGTAEGTPTDVSISGSTVTLTLAIALDAGQTNVTVDYTNPGTANDPLKDAADNEVATFTNQAVTNNAPACPDTASHPGDAYWTACLTLGQGSSFVGYAPDPSGYGALDPNSFTEGNLFVVSQLAQDTSTFYLGLATSDLNVAEYWVLQVGDTTLNLADATLTNSLFSWTRPAALNWDSATTVNNAFIGDKVSVSLTLGNRPPTGMPTISDDVAPIGTIQAGEVLTADVSGITDEDGLTTATYSYQWFRHDGNNPKLISGATDATYQLLSADDIGSDIYMEVTYTDDGGTEETVTSASVGPVGKATLTITPASQTVNEDVGTIDYSVMLSPATVTTGGSLAIELTSSITPADASKRGNENIVNNLPVNLEFLKGVTSPQTHTVNIDNDNRDEVDEVQEVTASFVGGGIEQLVEIAGTATATVRDDDDPPELELHVSDPSISEEGGVSLVSVRSKNETAFPDAKTFALTLGGSATETDDYTISGKTLTLAAGAMQSDTVTVTAQTDMVVDDNETIEITTADYTHITDSMTYSVEGAGITITSNTAPTATDNTVTMDEDENYTFTAGDFNFGDADTGDTLASVKIVSLAAAGELALAGTAVTENQVISSGDIGDLVFSPAADGNGASYDSFTFKVNDGEDDSVAVYTMTMNVDSVPDVTVVEVTSKPRLGTGSPKDTYGAGDPIQVTVTFDEEVTVTGSPVLSLEVGSNSQSMEYSGGSGTTALQFSLVVTASDSDSDGVSINANALNLEAGVSIENSGGKAADVSFAAISDLSGHKVDGSLSNTPATGAPEIEGLYLNAGHPLTAGLGTIADVDGLPTTTFPTGYSFQWVRQDGPNGGNPVNVGTGRTYTPVPRDEGKYIAVHVTFLDGADAEETRTAVTPTALKGSLFLFVGFPLASGPHEVNEGEALVLPAVQLLIRTAPDTFEPAPGASFDFGLQLVSVSNTAEADRGDYRALNKAATMTKGAASISNVTVQTLQDDEVEGDEYFRVTLDRGQGTRGLIRIVETRKVVTITIIDDDEPAELAISSSDVAVSEGSEASYTVALTAEPETDVTVSIASDDTTAATVAPAALTFTSSTWSEEQTVTVTGVEDTDLEDEAVTITHSGGMAVTDKTVAVAVRDNDCPGNHPPNAGVFWSACLTVQKATNGHLGYGSGFGSLSDDDFVVSGTTYTVSSLSHNASDGTLTLTLDSNPGNTADNWILQVGSRSLAFGSGATTVTWTSSTTPLGDAGWTTTQIGQNFRVSLRPATTVTPGLSFSETSVEAVEGESVEYTVALDTVPSSSVTVTVSSGDDNNVRVNNDSKSLTFTASDWNQGKTVTVTPIHDPDTEDETETITHSGAGVTTGTVTVEINDDDTAPTVSSAEVTAATPKELVVSFSTALDTGSVPAASAFAVKIGGNAGPAVTSVAIDGGDATKLKLGLAEALDAGQTSVTLDYTNPGAGNNPLQDAGPIWVGTFTDRAVVNNAPACPSEQPADAFWTACLTVGLKGGTTNILGYNPVESYGALTPTEFTVDTSTFTVSSLIQSGTNLTVGFSGGDPRPGSNSWALQVGDVSLLMSEGTYTSLFGSYTWTSPGVSWAEANSGDKVSVSLRVVDNTAPTVSGAEVTAAAPLELVVSFDEALATDSVPPTSAFTVKVDGGAGPDVTSVSIDSGDATKVKLDLAEALDAGQTPVTLDYTRPVTNPLQDEAENEVADFTGQAVVNNAPACPVSNPPEDAFWTACLTANFGSPLDPIKSEFGFVSKRPETGSATFGSLSDSSVSTKGGDNLTVTRLAGLYLAPNNPTRLDFDTTDNGHEDAARDWILVVDGQEYAFSEATYDSVTSRWTWDGPSWATQSGDKISVSLRVPNQAATGQPAISGAAVLGQVLTAEKGSIADNNGLAKADSGESGYAYAYQWIRVDSGSDTDIPVATSSTYTPVSDDLGKTLKVKVSFKDDEGYEEERTSAVTAPVSSSDTTAPQVTSIDRQTPSSSPTNADSLTWRVAFNEEVKNVDATDFTLNGTTATLSLSEVTAGMVYDVTASGGDLASLNATVTLGFASGQDIQDTSNNLLTDTVPMQTNHNTYVVDTTAPTFSAAVVQRKAPKELVITFSENLVSTTPPPAATAFTVQAGGNPRATVTDVAVSGDQVKLIMSAAFDSSEVPLTVAYDKPGSNPLRDAANNEVAAFSAQSVINNAPVCGQDEHQPNDFWSACLTVGASGNNFGYDSTAPYGALSDNAPTFDGAAYPLTGIVLNSSGELELRFQNPAPSWLVTGGWRLKVGDNTPLSINDAALQGNLYRWPSPGLSWANANVGDKVSVSLAQTSNQAATGQPTITGAAVLGQVLTASKGSIADNNGLTRADNGDSGYGYTYQWIRVAGDSETDIPAAASSTYTLVADDLGKTVKVRVSFKDDANYNEERSSAETATVTATDTTAPQVTSIDRQTPPSSPTNADTLTWRVAFNEEVKNVDATDFTVNGTTATLSLSEVTAGTVYDVTASGGNLANLNATVTLGFASSQDIQDTANNTLTDTVPMLTNHNTYTVDNMAPTLTIAVPATSTEPFTATFSFSEPVEGFAMDDVTVTNGAASAFTVTTPYEEWTALITPAASGTVTVAVGAGVVTDVAGNATMAAAQAVSTYTASGDGTPPPSGDPDATREGAVPLPAIETPQGEPSLYGQGGALDPANGDMIDYYSFTVPTTTTSQVSGQLQRLAAARGEASPLTIAQQVAIQVEGQSGLMKVTLEDEEGRSLATAYPAPSNPSVQQINALLEPGVYYIKVEASEAVPVDYNLRLALTTAPPLSVAVADARAEEGADAFLQFQVTLDRPATATVTVDYASEDDTATAGVDYVAASGALTFQAGEKEQTVSVVVLEDALEEGEEQLRLRLSNPSAGLTIRDGEATGVITETNAVPIDWLARFGRTVTDQVLEAVEQRLKPGRQEGVQVQIAGQAVPVDGNQPAILRLDGNEEQPAQPPLLERWLLSRKLPSAQEWVTGSSFALTTTEEDSQEEKGSGGHLSLWGLGAIAGFDGRQHDFSLDGQVTTALMGTDWATGQWTAGLALGRSTGTGHYRQSDCATDRCSGDIEATLTGLYPYVGGVQHNDRRTLWAAAGYGMGDLTLRSPNGKRFSTDLTMTMGAAGLRSQLAAPEDNGDGFSLAVKGDARFTRTSSKELPSAEGSLSAAEADIWRLRVGIEAARPMTVGAANATVTPSFEMGLRLDGGDADTGFGTDIGAGVVLANPRNGIHLDLAARGLVAHETADFQEWGAVASLSWDPQPDIEQGFAAQLTQAWGASPSGGMEALLQRQSMAEVAATDGNGEAVRFVASSRLEAELGYGLPLWDGAFTLTPNIGFAFSETVRDYRIGWRLSPAPPPAAAYHPLELELDVTRSERTDSDAPATHGVMLRSTLLW